MNSTSTNDAPIRRIVTLSRIVNNTTQQVDIDLLTKSIRQTLLESGKVVTTTTFGSDTNVEDPVARDIQKSRQMAEGRQPTVTDLPDYTLSGRIIEVRS